MRYLEQAMKLESGFFEKLSLVVEGLRERNYMVNSLPYLNTEVKLVVPLFNPWQMVYYGCGVYIYHLISYIHWLRSSYKIKFSRPEWYGKAKMKELFPNLKPCRGVMFAEGQMIDTRTLVQTLLTTTIESYNGGFVPANIANYTEVKKIIKKDGKAVGVEVHDKISNKTFNIYAKAIINCAGPYSDDVRKLDNPHAAQRIVGSNGVHLILKSAPYTPKDIGIFIPKTKDGRVMFVIPYQGKTLSGTTDHNCKIDPSPIVPESDIKEITKELDNYFIDTHPEKNILASWNGIRPLVIDKKYEGKQIDTSDTKLFTRLHVVDFSESGVASLMGGKWTSYRQMGYDAVQEVIERNPKIMPVFKTPVTTSLKLYGSYTSELNKRDSTNPRAFIPIYENFMQKQYSIPADVAKHLVYYYGTKSVHIAELGKQINGLDKIVPEEPYIQAEVAYVIRHEMAVNLKDVVFRRLGLGFLNTELAKGQFAANVAGLMQKELHWSDSEKQSQINELLSSLNSLN
jgi:glycerol-3-phosphate dehydrogenase